MRALVWHHKKDIRREDVPDPRIEQPDDAIVKVTSYAICGTDLHQPGGRLAGGHAIRHRAHRHGRGLGCVTVLLKP
jgi:threonine dehydrogenase-like Zn-dependent dehydrogenase